MYTVYLGLLGLVIVIDAGKMVEVPCEITVLVRVSRAKMDKMYPTQLLTLFFRPGKSKPVHP